VQGEALAVIHVPNQMQKPLQELDVAHITHLDTFYVPPRKPWQRGIIFYKSQTDDGFPSLEDLQAKSLKNVEGQTRYKLFQTLWDPPHKRGDNPEGRRLMG
jgi:hypothetical protein